MRAYFAALPLEEIPNIEATVMYLSGSSIEFGLDIIIAGLKARWLAECPERRGRRQRRRVTAPMTTSWDSTLAAGEPLVQRRWPCRAIASPHQIPLFDDPADERRHRKQRLAAGFRLFGHFGFDEGVAGHITARDPERSDHFWVNPFGMHFSQIRVKDLSWSTTTARSWRATGRSTRPRSASTPRSTRPGPTWWRPPTPTRIHGKAFSALHRRLDPITQDACSFFDDHEVFDDYAGVVVDIEEGKRIAHALGDYKACILSNHGLLTVGHSVDEAVWWFLAMERCCQAQLLAMAAGATAHRRRDRPPHPGPDR